MARKVKDDIDQDGIKSNVPPDVIQRHFREIHKLATQIKDFSAELQAAFKRAKSDGVPIDALKMARKLHKMDSLEAQMLLRQVGYIGQVLGMPFATQLKMFGDVAAEVSAEEAQENRNFDAIELGRVAGKEGASKTLNPFVVGTQEHTFWVKGWNAGDEARLKIAAASGVVVTKPRGRRGKGAVIVDGQQMLQ